MAKCPQPDKKQAAPLEESACFLIKLLTKMSCAWSAAWSVLPLNQIRVIDGIAYIVCASRYREKAQGRCYYTQLQHDEQADCLEYGY